MTAENNVKIILGVLMAVLTVIMRPLWEMLKHVLQICVAKRNTVRNVIKVKVHSFSQKVIVIAVMEDVQML